MRLLPALLLAALAAAAELPAEGIAAALREEGSVRDGVFRALVPAPLTVFVTAAHEVVVTPAEAGATLGARMLLDAKAAEALPKAVEGSPFRLELSLVRSRGIHEASLSGSGEPVALARAFRALLDALPALPQARGLSFPRREPLREAFGVEPEPWGTAYCVVLGGAGRAIVCGRGEECFVLGERSGEDAPAAVRAAGFAVESQREGVVRFFGEGRIEDLARNLRTLLPDALRIDFSDPAALEGWKSESTGIEGPQATWEVKEGVCALSATNHDAAGAFNLRWARAPAFRDGTISVRIRADAGEIDQGGGLLWRAKDRDHYYVARYNPLEKNLRIYHVKGGKRTTLADAGGIEIAAGRWFTLSIVVRGARIEASLDGKRLLEVEDATFPDAGGFGFWTKADARSSFDDLGVLFR